MRRQSKQAGLNSQIHKSQHKSAGKAERGFAQKAKFPPTAEALKMIRDFGAGIAGVPPARVQRDPDQVYKVFAKQGR